MKTVKLNLTTWHQTYCC